MGTNYYVQENYCGHCGRGDDLHIGKSSGGWCFALQTYPERDLNTLDDWRTFLVGKPIRNEYRDAVTVDELLSTITERSGRRTGRWWVGYQSEQHWYAANYAQPGPSGLARHRIGSPGCCVGHGEGTWDYMRGEFS